MDDHKNFAYSTLAASASSAQTSISVQTGDGALFPTAPFNCTLWPASTQPLSSNAEIVRVTAISGDTFTITRAQEGTTALTAASGAQIANTITDKVLTDIENVFTSDASQSYLGYDTVGASWETMTSSRFLAKQFTLTEGALVSIEAYLRRNGSQVEDVGWAIWTDNAGTPDVALAGGRGLDNQIYLGGTSDPTPGRWYRVSSAIWLEAGTYWGSVAGFDMAGSHQIAYDTGGSDRYFTNGGGYYISDWTLSGTWAETISSNRYSIRFAVVAPTLNASPGEFVGAKAYHSAQQNINTTTAPALLDSEEYDSHGFHSAASTAVSPRMTIPTGQGGKYLIQGGTLGSGAADWIGFRKNGSTALRGYQTALTSGAFYRSASTIVELAEGDYVEMLVSTSSNIDIGHSSLPDAQSWLAISRLVGSALAIGTDAEDVAIVDTAGKYAATNVETALAEARTITYESRSSNTILGTADSGKFIDCSAAFTQTFDAAATLGAGWWVDIRNATTDGSSVLTLDADSTETIDGATTMHMWSGEVRRVICTGSGFVTMLLSPGLGLYAQRTTSLTSYSSTEASQTDLVGVGAQTYDAVPILIEGNAQGSISSGSIIIGLWDDTTYLCRFIDFRQGGRGDGQIKITPSAGSHTYILRVFGNGGNSIDADSGSGGSGTYPPAFMRIRKL